MLSKTKVIPLLVVAQIALFLTSCTKTERAATGQREHRAILYFNYEGEFTMDYQGTGYRQASGQGGEAIYFKAMHFDGPAPKNAHDAKLVDASFDGELKVSGPDQRDVTFDLKVTNKVAFVIRLLGIQKKGEKASNEAYEQLFPPGEHVFKVDGVIVGYYERTGR